MASEAQILAIANQKGGVGKTTTAVNLAHGLVQKGRRVLLVDLDAQANSTSVLWASGDDGAEDREVGLEASIHAAFKDKAPIQGLIQPTRIEGLALCASHVKLAEVENLLAGAVDGFFRLSESLRQGAEDYDFVILDCPPNLGMLTVNAFVASKHLLVPLQTAKFSLDGLTAILETASTIRSRFNSNFSVLGALVTIHNPRTAISQAFIEPIADYMHLFETRISRAVAVEEAHMMQRTIFEYAPQSKVAQEYAALTEEVLRGVQEG